MYESFSELLQKHPWALKDQKWRKKADEATIILDLISLQVQVLVAMCVNRKEYKDFKKNMTYLQDKYGQANHAV